MADKRCFVQFSHPGYEHEPDRNGRIGWHRFRNGHRRKFTQLFGEWIDRDGSRHSGKLRAWGEWEAESRVIPAFEPPNRGPHDPRYLWEPYWVPKNTYRGLHNTDPFIFGDCFFFSNCGQLARNKRGLKHLDVGSVIAFGSGQTIHNERKWVLDTVIVVADSFRYDPLNPREALDGKVPEAFLSVTGGPLAEDPQLKERNNAGETQEFRHYRGATLDDPVHGMFSFFPAISADGEASFPRPVICLDDRYFNPASWQAPKGAGHHLSRDTIRDLWNSLVAQVRKVGLALGTHAEMPEHRVG